MYILYIHPNKYTLTLFGVKCIYVDVCVRKCVYVWWPTRFQSGFFAAFLAANEEQSSLLQTLDGQSCGPCVVPVILRISLVHINTHTHTHAHTTPTPPITKQLHIRSGKMHAFYRISQQRSIWTIHIYTHRVAYYTSHIHTQRVRLFVIHFEQIACAQLTHTPTQRTPTIDARLYYIFTHPRNRVTSNRTVIATARRPLATPTVIRKRINLGFKRNHYSCKNHHLIKQTLVLWIAINTFWPWKYAIFDVTIPVVAFKWHHSPLFSFAI